MKQLTFTCRHSREYTDPDVPCREENFDWHQREITVPADQSALVLVDCWDRHPVVSFVERAERVARERILPVVQPCREAGVRRTQGYTNDPYARPAEPLLEQWLADDNLFPGMRIMSFLEPGPQDFVVATGEQLHRLCRHREILHLFYAGFAANICVQFRDYGIRAMRDRGYHIILLRDCTTAIEGSHTLDGEWLTQAAIFNIELKVGCSTTSEELQAACGR